MAGHLSSLIPHLYPSLTRGSTAWEGPESRPSSPAKRGWTQVEGPTSPAKPAAEAEALPRPVASFLLLATCSICALILGILHLSMGPRGCHFSFTLICLRLQFSQLKFRHPQLHSLTFLSSSLHILSIARLLMRLHHHSGGLQ